MTEPNQSYEQLLAENEALQQRLQELTDRDTLVQLNRELMQQVEDYQTLVNTLPLPLAVAQDPECQQVWINLAFADMLQLPPGANASFTGPGKEELTFRYFRNGVELGLDELPMRQAIALGQEMQNVEFDLVRKDGVTLHLFGHATPLFDEQGDVRGCIGAWADITARKLAEDALKTADQRKDEFLAILAHELRNPLAPLRSGLDLLQLGLQADESPAVLEMMNSQLNHIIRLVDEVLEVSRITRGVIELRKERLEIRSIIQRAIETTQKLLGEMGHALALSLPFEPVYLDGDPVRLTQIVGNLLQNAAKYTERGGQIELSVRNPPPADPHSVLDAEKPQFVEISVRDNGLGIDAQMLPHVFDLFEQAGASRSQSRGGLGIGLMLTSKLVQLHGGSIKAESQGKGHGSTFTVQIPAAPPPEPVPIAAPAADSASAAPTNEKARILVVDDNRDAAECLARLLELLHKDVQVAHDGLAALEAASGFQPRLVILDLGMPGMDGLETARRLRMQPGSSEMILVALSGWGQEEDRRKTREAGFAAHLVKPIEFGLLQKVVGELLGERR